MIYHLPKQLTCAGNLRMWWNFVTRQVSTPVMKFIAMPITFDQCAIFNRATSQIKPQYSCGVPLQSKNY